MPAQTTAKMVMASAKRLMLVRHRWRSRNRMAEMSVPAWPMPTQNTKFTMAQPQPTVLLTPQTPTPVVIRWKSMANSNTVSPLVKAKAMYQARGGLGCSTIPQTLSVSEVKSSSPSTSSGGGPGRRACCRSALAEARFMRQFSGSGRGGRAAAVRAA